MLKADLLGAKKNHTSQVWLIHKSSSGLRLQSKTGFKMMKFHILKWCCSPAQIILFSNVAVWSEDVSPPPKNWGISPEKGPCERKWSIFQASIFMGDMLLVGRFNPIEKTNARQNWVISSSFGGKNKKSLKPPRWIFRGKLSWHVNFPSPKISEAPSPKDGKTHCSFWPTPHSMTFNKKWMDIMRENEIIWGRLMVQKSQGQPPFGGTKNPGKQWDKLPTSTG